MVEYINVRIERNGASFEITREEAKAFGLRPGATVGADTIRQICIHRMKKADEVAARVIARIAGTERRVKPVHRRYGDARPDRRM